jgi:membrane protease YdiL (CAAX protease family)
MVAGSSTWFFALDRALIGWVLLILGLGIAAVWARPLVFDLMAPAAGIAILTLLPGEIGLDAGGSAHFAVVLALALVVPWAFTRFVTRSRSVEFAWSGGRRWSRKQWLGLAVVPFVGCVVLAPYLIWLDGHEFWPPIQGLAAAVMLAVGIFGLGLWEELFLVGVLAQSVRPHVAAWVAIAMRVAIAVPLLWSWGFQGLGPVIIAAFAVFQGLLWERTRSLGYVTAVHLAFDVALIVTLLWARYPGWLDGTAGA